MMDRKVCWKFSVLLFCVFVTRPLAPAFAIGNVTVEVTKGGDLYVTGEDDSQAIAIRGTAQPGEYEIEEMFTGRYGSTTINGQPGLLNTGGLGVVTGDAVISMGRGEHYVGMVDVQIGGALRATFGDDADTLDLTYVECSTLNVRLGDGENTFSGLQSSVAGRGKIVGGNGLDRIDTDTFSFEGSIVTKGGDDEIYVGDAYEPRARLNIRTSKGLDAVELSNVNSSDSIRVKTGAEDDWVRLYLVNVGGAAQINGGSGTDTLEDLGGHTGTIVITGFEQ